MRAHKLFNLSLGLMLAGGLFLTACGGTTAQSTAPPTPQPTTAVTPATEPAPLNDPAQLVRDFLASLQDDPSGKSSLPYLSQALQADVQSGHPLATILGIEDMYPSFGVSSVQTNDAGDRATVEVTLNYARPIQRVFVLIQEEDVWRIDTIIAYAVPPTVVSSDFLEADQVITEYVRALQDKQAAEAWGLLTAEAQSQTSEADIAAEAQAVQRVTVTSLTLIETSQNRLLYAATLWATPNPGRSNEWTQGSNSRWFELELTPLGWRIAHISPSPISNVAIATPGAEERVTVTPTGISFEVPQDWQRLGTEWSWASNDSGELRVGVNWNNTGPGWQPTAMLPNHSQTLQTSPVDLGWAQGTSYTVAVTATAAQGGGVLAVEKHVIVVQVDKPLAYDFYASAPSAGDLVTLHPVLQHMLDTVEIGNE
jgi:hypothetical protein